jgi:hypothetical protein
VAKLLPNHATTRLSPTASPPLTARLPSGLLSDAKLAALEQRMIPAPPIVLEATAEVSDDAGELPDGDTEAGQDG